jgi:CBS domain containing-hemolysin-like protein
MIEITIAIIGLIFSSLYAGTESAFLSFNKIKLDIWKKEKRKFTRNADFFFNNPEEFFTTILVGNNFSNIIYSTFATIFLLQYFDEFLSWMLLTFVVLFFGEIYPKTLARQHSDRIILNLLVIIRTIYFLLKPLVAAINALLSLFMRMFNLRSKPMLSFFSREEIEALIQESSATILKHNAERKYVDNALDFSEIKVREALTPRIDVVALELTDSIEDMEAIVKQFGHSRIPVYKDNLDNIVGVVFMYDLLNEPQSIKEIIKPVQTTFENTSCAELLKEFQKKNISIAVVLDEYGGMEGIVTSTDLIEVIFGEFYRQGEDGYIIKKLNRFTYEVDARIDLDELTEQIAVEIPEGEYETLSGFILNIAGRILQKEESLEFKDFRIEVIDASPSKINKVKIVLKKNRR